MQYETGINYFDLKKKRQEALEVASKCNPGNGKMIARGVRGIDLHPQIKPSHVTRGNRKTETSEVIRMHNEGKTYGEIAEFYNVTKQSISYIVLRYNRANGIATEPPKTRKGVIEETWHLHSEGKSYDEIAEMMKCKKKTIKQRIRTYKLKHGK